jgi:hypothetical protein
LIAADDGGTFARERRRQDHIVVVVATDVGFDWARLDENELLGEESDAAAHVCWALTELAAQDVTKFVEQRLR